MNQTMATTIGSSNSNEPARPKAAAGPARLGRHHRLSSHSQALPAS
jgi:hypothetical protein